MERFIARENIRRFKAKLVLCTDERQRETLKGLLAAEKEKLQKLDSKRAACDKQQPVEIEERQSELPQEMSDEVLVTDHQNDNQGWPTNRSS